MKVLKIILIILAASDGLGPDEIVGRLLEAQIYNSNRKGPNGNRQKMPSWMNDHSIS